jgi:hypothetical protein
MMGCPHLLQATDESGGRSARMKTLVSQLPQVTIFKEAFSSALMSLQSMFGTEVETLTPFARIQQGIFQ